MDEQQHKSTVLAASARCVLRAALPPLLQAQLPQQQLQPRPVPSWHQVNGTTSSGALGRSVPSKGTMELQNGLAWKGPLRSAHAISSFQTIPCSLISKGLQDRNQSSRENASSP